MSQFYRCVGFYFIIINFVSFAMFFIDKRRAVRREYRISENNLLLSCALGGSIGGIIAMNVFHHKTHKWKFRILPILFFVLQVYIFIKIKQSF